MPEKFRLTKDLKEMNIDELNALAADIRRFLIDSISKTGGHLAANLGVVELTLALFLEFDPYSDRIVWDVGHQAYIHKMLTDRADRFDTLRKLDGISGFPKMSESKADAFNTGHSSTSVSAVTGFAAAARLRGTNERAVAVIGDGAMTGGMVYEALNHAGSENLPVIVVLNDNGMSISKNVGGIANRLKRLRTTGRYFKLKAEVKSFLSHIPLIGKPLRKGIARIKRAIRKLLLPAALFEDLGFKYLGPADGHNIEDLRVILRQAKKLNAPVVVHVNTKKGKGYVHAEKNPDFFHGVQSFDADTGKTGGSAQSWSDYFGERLCDLAESNDKVVAITAAMPLGTGLDKFSKKFRDRFFDVAIAEQHAVTFSAAMAAGGFVPVTAVYSTFLQRAYDQIIHDCALMNLHTVFCIDRCGIVGSDGETHQGVFDIAYMTQIPNMTVLSPSNKTDFDTMLDFAVNKINSPVSIRYPRGEAKSLDVDYLEPTKTRLVKSGTDILITAVGVTLYDALAVAEMLEKQGVSAAVADVRCIKPIDTGFMKKHSADKKLVVAVEDGTEIGGFGQQLESLLNAKVLKFAYPDEPIVQGSCEQLKDKYGLSAEKIAQRILEEYNG